MAIVILMCGFVMFLYKSNKKKLDIVYKEKPRVVIKSTELEAKTYKNVRYDLERMKQGNNTLLDDNSRSPIVDTSLDEDLRKRK